LIAPWSNAAFLCWSAIAVGSVFHAEQACSS
jgi:hypothetical protein